MTFNPHHSFKIILIILFFNVNHLAISQEEFENENISKTLSNGEFKERIQLSEKTIELPKLELTYYWFYKNQVFNTQGSYSGLLLNGPYSSFYNSNNLKEQGEFKMGLKVGVWLYWNESGVLVKQENWTKGQLCNYTYYYNISGSDSLRIPYKKNEINGLVEIYEDGKYRKQKIEKKKDNDSKDEENKTLFNFRKKNTKKNKEPIKDES